MVYILVMTECQFGRCLFRLEIHHEGQTTNCKINASILELSNCQCFSRRFCMSHHFDTKLAREDPSLNLCDFYLFEGPSGKTVMAMTVNPDVGLSAPDTLHPEGLYAFRFDLKGDAREEVTFKFRFGEPRYGDGSEHTHIQPFVVRKATGDDALPPAKNLILFSYLESQNAHANLP